MIFGKPLILWLGVTTLILLIATAKIGYLHFKGNPHVKFAWHKYLAIVLVIIAVIHGALGILAYF